MAAVKPAGKADEWSPHIWLGCDLFAWLRLLWLGRFSFRLKKLYLLPLCTLFAIFHTVLRYAQTGLYGQRIRDVEFSKPPIFILGHWRSGTTLLHELLVLDPRHTFPNTYQCFDPAHFLISESFIRKHCNWLLPSKRMMDNMPVGWARPQEEEFALALMGQPSIYNTIAFPARGALDDASLELDNLPAWQKRTWKRALQNFLRAIAVRDPRRMVLKSPPHTSRIPTLLELFPDARFIHLVRDPIAVYSSTVNLWKSMYRTQSLGSAECPEIEERVFDTFMRMHKRLDATRGLIPADRFHELRYEELVRDPIGELQKIYERLDLEDFETVRPHLEKYLEEHSRYERNRWQPTEEQLDAIRSRWGEVMRRYGYLEDRPAVAA